MTLLFVIAVRVMFWVMALMCLCLVGLLFTANVSPITGDAADMIREAIDDRRASEGK